MTDTTKKLRSLGIQARAVLVPPAAQFELLKDREPPPDWRAYSDEELLACIALIEQDVERITIHLADEAAGHDERPLGWRGSACAALGHKRAALKAAMREYDRRNPPGSALLRLKIQAREMEMAAAREAKEAKQAEKEARQAAQNADVARAAAMRAERALRHVALQQAQEASAGDRDRAFKHAARLMLSPEQMEAIWRRSVEMFPELKDAEHD